MKYDLTFFPSNNIQADIDKITHAESLGLDGVWTAEVAHNPFFPLTLGAKQTRNIQLGTQIAVAFPRTPMVTAQIATIRRTVYSRIRHTGSRSYNPTF